MSIPTVYIPDPGATPLTVQPRTVVRREFLITAWVIIAGTLAVGWVLQSAIIVHLTLKEGK